MLAYRKKGRSLNAGQRIAAVQTYEEFELDGSPDFAVKSRRQASQDAGLRCESRI